MKHEHKKGVKCEIAARSLSSFQDDLSVVVVRRNEAQMMEFRTSRAQEIMIWCMIHAKNPDYEPKIERAK